MPGSMGVLSVTPPSDAGEGENVITVTSADGKSFSVIARVDTPQEVEYVAHGGILQYVLRQRAQATG